MSPEELIGGWIAEVDAFEPTRTGDLRADAQANMLLFSFCEALDHGVSVGALAAFVAHASERYERAAAAADPGLWFYAWLDEMSGTLRVSSAPLAGVEDLPFRASLAVTDSAEVLVTKARDILQMDYSEDDEPGEYVLPVYARALGSTPAV